MYSVSGQSVPCTDTVNTAVPCPSAPLSSSDHCTPPLANSRERDGKGYSRLAECTLICHKDCMSRRRGRQVDGRGWGVCVFCVWTFVGGGGGGEGVLFFLNIET